MRPEDELTLTYYLRPRKFRMPWFAVACSAATAGFGMLMFYFTRR